MQPTMRKSFRLQNDMAWLRKTLVVSNVGECCQYLEFQCMQEIRVLRVIIYKGCHFFTLLTKNPQFNGIFPKFLVPENAGYV